MTSFKPSEALKFSLESAMLAQFASSLKTLTPMSAAFPLTNLRRVLINLKLSSAKFSELLTSAQKCLMISLDRELDNTALKPLKKKISHMTPRELSRKWA